MVLEHRAGEKLFIDFAGKTLSYIDRDTGEEISCPVLVQCTVSLVKMTVKIAGGSRR